MRAFSTIRSNISGNLFLECNALTLHRAYGGIKALQKMTWPTYLGKGVSVRSSDGRNLPHGERLVG